MRLAFGAIWAAAVLAIVPAQAQRAAPAAAFGAREGVSSASLSPNGLRMAFIAPAKGQGNALFTVPVDGSAPAQRAIMASGNPERLSRCDWVSDARLVCTVFALRAGPIELVATSRLIALDADGGNVKLVSSRDRENAPYFSRFGGDVIDWLPGQDGAILMGRNYVPESKIGSLIEKREEGYGVDRVDTATLERKRVVGAIPAAGEYISDGEGNVRIYGAYRMHGTGLFTGVVRYRYRRPGRDGWEDLSEYDTITREGFNPYAVDPVENVAYGFRKLNGRQALYKVALDGSGREALIFKRDDVDIDGLIRIGRKGRIVGLSYATERRQARYFDPDLARLRTQLAKALPQSSMINFEGASADEQKLLLWAGSDIDPGRYYVFDRQAKQLKPVILNRPELADYTLARVKPVSISAHDGAQIPGYLTLPPGSTGKGLPAIVMPHGGPGARDEWGFDWLAQYFANRGYAVLQPNFRGSAGYGDAWFQNNGFQSWRTAIGDVTDSGRWLVSQGIADPSKLAIFGWSYGGYAALQSGVTAPDLFKAIVAVAPVTDLDDLKAQYKGRFDAAVARDFIGSGPHVREGSPARHASSITAPVMLFHGDLDQNVRVEASRLMADRLRAAGKRHEIILYPGLDHYLEDSAVRAEMLAKSDAFIRAATGHE